MTPTTAEQMPDFRLIRKMLETRAYALTGGCPIAKEQVERLTSWLAQGGARGGDAALHLAVCQAVQLMQTGVPFMDHAELIKAQDILRESLIAYADAALAPRAEAGKAVLTNPYTGTPRDYRDVESDPSGILIAVPGEPLRPHKPTAACGVSGLVGKWRDAANLSTSTTEAQTLDANADELEAALKANRGGVSDEQVEAARHAILDSAKFAGGGLTPEAMRAALTAALNAGALAGGEVKPIVTQVTDKMITYAMGERIDRLEKGSTEVQAMRAALHLAIWEYERLRSLVVGGVGQ